MEKEKMYCVRYKPVRSKKMHEEIFTESQLLDETFGALRFVSEGFKFFSIKDGVEYLDALFNLVTDIEIDESIAEQERNFKIMFGEFFDSIPDNLKSNKLHDLTVISWPSHAGEKSFVVNHKDATYELVRDIFNMRKDADFLEIEETEGHERKIIEKKRYWVAVQPYASQNGTIMVPADIPADEVDTYISEHFGEIEFGEPQLDYKGIDYEFGEE